MDASHRGISSEAHNLNPASPAGPEGVEDDLRRIIAHVRCIIWYAHVEGLPGWEQDVTGKLKRFRWTISFKEEQAAQAILPLAVPPGASYGDVWWLSRHEEDRSRIDENALLALIEGRGSYSQEFRCYDKDGNERWMYEDVYVEPRGHGRWHAVGTATDITPRKLLEFSLEQRTQELAEAVRRRDETLATLEVLLKGAPVGFALLDTSFRYVRVNDAWAAMKGIRIEEHLGRTVWEVMPQSQAEVVVARLKQVIGTGQPLANLELKVVPPRGGEAKDALVSYYPVRTAEGRLLGVGTTAVDLSYKKQIQEMQQARDAAEAANEAKDQFMAMLSHELRTPLTPVLATVSVWESSGEVPEALQGDVDLIRRNVETEARLIDDLLDVTRIARGKLPLRKRVLDLHEVVRGAATVCNADLGAKGIELSYDLNATRRHVSADPHRLQQAVWNLIKNAVKFTPAGGRITLRTSDLGADRVRVEVSDTGIGIEPEVLPRIFDPFEQGEKEVTRQFGGLGLGLAISKGIIESHGGRITARSEGRNCGAQFTLDLPAVPAPAPDGAAELRPAVRVRPPGQRILLVEDHRDTANTLSRLLHQMDFEVAIANSAAAARRLASEHRFDLLISDLGLPDGDGLALVRELKLEHAVPAIALTGFGTDSDVQKSKDAGFSAHLTKPIDFQRLQQTIEELTGDPARQPT